MVCTNNLKQLALAAHVYRETGKDGTFPPGSVAGSSPYPDQRLGVFVHLLPYLEEEALYKQLNVCRGWEAPENATAMALKVKGFRCPADHRKGVANYVAVAGSGLDAPFLPLDDPRAGAFGHDRTVGRDDFKGEMSNTLFFLETHHDTGPWASAAATLRGVDPDDETPIGKGRAFGVHHAASEWNWGRMPGEANAALGDGSVRTLSAKTSAELLSALATVAGGEDVAAMEW